MSRATTVIALVTNSTAHAAATNTRDALIAAGFESSNILMTADSGPAPACDVIVITRGVDTQGDYDTCVKTAFESGTPVIFGSANVSSGEYPCSATFAKLTGNFYVNSSTINIKAWDLLSDAHPITTGLAVARHDLYTGFNFLFHLLAGDSLAPSGLLSPQPFFNSTGFADLVPLEAGHIDLLGNPTAARCVIFGNIYGGQTGYTAFGAELIGRCIDWAVGAAAAPDTTAPVLTTPTAAATGATTYSGTVSTDEANGTLYWLVNASASATGTEVKAGASQAVSTTGVQNVSGSGLTHSTSYYTHYLHRDAAGNDSTVSTSAQFTTDAADVTAPILTLPTGTAVGHDSATGSVSTDEANGTLYAVVTTSATPPSESDIRAGTGAVYATSQAVSTIGAQSVSVDELLTASTTYYWHFLHDDAAGNASNIASASFTTSATPAVIKGVRVTTSAVSVTGITAIWWDSNPPTGSPAFSTATASTDASGILELNLDATTTLAVGQLGTLVLYKLDGTDHQDSLGAITQLPIIGIA